MSAGREMARELTFNADADVRIGGAESGSVSGVASRASARKLVQEMARNENDGEQSGGSVSGVAARASARKLAQEMAHNENNAAQSGGSIFGVAARASARKLAQEMACSENDAAQVGDSISGVASRASARKLAQEMAHNENDAAQVGGNSSGGSVSGVAPSIPPESAASCSPASCAACGGCRARDAARPREAWLDAIRFGAAFLVIVNHTNSLVFKATTPAQTTWWLSILWYYCSKVAVPLFVMVSGACLLPRVDGYRRTLARAGRMLGALMLFSYGYYLHDAWVYWGLWPRMANVGAFLRLVCTNSITDSFWYLPFYLGLLAMLPMLQRMRRAMSWRDVGYLVGACFLLDGALPLMGHYLPAREGASYFYAPMFAGYIGLFFAGDWVRRGFRPTRRAMLGAGLVLAASLALSVALTRLEYARVDAGVKYWFMDDRLRPSCLTMLASTSAMMLCKGWFGGVKRGARALTELGGCAFGVYLLQDWLIAQTEKRLFVPMCGVMPAMLAVLVWELAVFAVALAVAWVLRRLPVFRKVM